jgi:hypothetical protein
MNGYVYVMLNPAFPHLVKVGRTTRSSSARAEELFSTGTPQKFIVAYDVFVDNCVEIELLVHEELKSFRYSENREFFEYSLSEVIKCVERISKDRRVESKIQESFDDDVDHYIYCAFLGDGDQWMKWTNVHIKNKIYRFGAIVIEGEHEESEIFKLANTQIISSLSEYYSYLGPIEPAKIKLIDISHAGLISPSYRARIEELIQQRCEEFCSENSRSAEIVYDQQTISYKLGEAHEYFRQLSSSIHIDVFQYIESYQEERRQRAAALEKSKRAIKAATLKGNF